MSGTAARATALALVVLLGASILVPSALGGHLGPTVGEPVPNWVPRDRGAAPGAFGGVLDPRLAGGNGRIIVNTTDPQAVPNDGLRTNMSAFAPGPLPANTSFQAGAEEVIGGYEAVFGVFENDFQVPTPFFSVFTNVTDQTAHLAYWTGYPLIEGHSYDFELVRTNGTLWSLTVNGELFGNNSTEASFDFGAPSASWGGGIGFSEIAIFASAGPTVPDDFLVPLAFAVHGPSGWYLPNVAQATYVGSAGHQWGIGGRSQHPTLAPGEVESGPSVANVTAGTVLWSGGVVPLQVGVRFSSPSVAGTTPVTVAVTVATSMGTPVPGVSVYLHDHLGGTMVPPAVLTNSSGGATTLFLTPNVSSSAQDLVGAVVTLFGYSGAAAAALTLDPPLQVVLSVSPPGAVLSPNAGVVLTFHAADISGRPLPQIVVTYTLQGIGTLSNGFGETDGTGATSVNLTAGASAGTLTVLAKVDTVGAWGHVSASWTVRAPPPTFLTAYGPALALVAVAAVVILAGGLVYRRLRARRKALPPMGLSRILAERARAPPDGPPSSPGTPRRPPQP